MTVSKFYLLSSTNYFLFAPNLEFHVERADGVNEDEQKDGILRTIQVANAPCKRDDRQMDQVRIERSAANAAHKRNAEELSQKALARKEAHHEHAVNENREAMVDKIIVSRVSICAHEEEASIKRQEQKRLRDAAHKIFLEEIEHALVVKAIEHHAEQVFKNTHRRKHVEEPVLRIVTVEPKIARITVNNRPKNPRNKHRAKQHPKCAAVLLDQPTAKPRRNGIAKEKARQGPRRFIQLHAEIGSDRPREREVHQEAPPRMEHLRKSRRCAVANL